MSDWKIVPDSGSEWSITDEGGLSPEDQKRLERMRGGLNNTGPIEQVRAELDPTKITMGAMLRRDADQVKRGLRNFHDQASQGLPWLGPAANSMLDQATGHGATAALNFDRKLENPISRAVDSAVGDIPVLGPILAKRGGRTADETVADINRVRADHPITTGITDLPAYLSPRSAPSQIASTLERVLPNVTTRVGRLAKTIVGSGLTGATLAGTNAAAQGASPAEVGSEALHGGGAGVAVATALGIPASMLGAVADSIVNSKAGQSRRFLEERGVPVGPTSPGRGGHITDADIGAAGERANQDVKAGMEEYRGKVASEPYQEAVSQVTPAQANQKVDATGVLADMIQAANRPRIHPDVAATLDRNIGILTKNYVPGSGPLMVTQEYLNELRGSLQDAINFNSNEPKFSPLREAYSKAKALVDQGPYAEANRRMATGLQDFQQSMDMLDLSRTKSRAEPIKGNLRVAAGRSGQNTVTAGADTVRMDRDAFRAKHPELAAKLDEPEILRKSADLNFSLLPKKHGGLIERTGSLGAALTGADALMHAYGSGHFSLGQLAGAGGLALAMQNLPAIQARLLYGPSLGMQVLEPLLLDQVPAAAAASQSGARRVEKEVR